jgi:signal transduction histidine kinase
MNGQSPELDTLLGVVAACTDESGQLVQANAGFSRIMDADTLPVLGANVAHLFIQPDFASLLTRPAAGDGEVYAGLLTFGNFSGQTRTLKARVWHVGRQIRLLADFDIEALEQVNDTVMELNRAYASMQVELAQSNFKLKQQQAQLEQSMAELQATNTRLAQVQSQLVQSEKLASIGLLAAGVAHEINNPLGYVTANVGTLKIYVTHLLAIIAAFDAAQASARTGSAPSVDVEALKQTLDLPYLKDDVPQLFNESQQGLDRVKRIVQALNEFARVDTVDVWQLADLHVGIDNMLDLFWGKFSHRCELQKAYGALPRVMCVVAQLNQVFMNLLLNAAQSVETNGTVTIRSASAADEVWVEVEDTGHGIAADDLRHIFDPFFTTRPVGQGLGLGLSVSFGIVAKHGGRIEVSSELGKGSVFRVCLPIVQVLSTESTRLQSSKIG